MLRITNLYTNTQINKSWYEQQKTNIRRFVSKFVIRNNNHMLKRKTKIILAIVAGIVVLVPIVFCILIMAAASVSQNVDYASTRSFSGSTGAASEGFALTERAMPSEDYYTTADSLAPTETTYGGETAAEVDQKIIKTGYLELVVDSASETAAQISALATSKGGYAQDTSISEDENGTKYGSTTVRIPANDFENAMTEIKKMAVSVETESTNGQDVTEEYTDLEAQLSNAQAQEKEYLVILQKAESVEDILSVQSYLGQVREQIEMLQGRIKYLSNLTSYSTITVYLSEEPSINLPSKEFRPWTAVKEAAQAVIVVLQGLVITGIWLIILGGGVLIPIIAVVWLIVWAIKKIWRRRHNKK